MAFKIGQAARDAAYARQQAAAVERRAALRARLVEAVERHGPASVYAELLAEHDRAQADLAACLHCGAAVERGPSGRFPGVCASCAQRMLDRERSEVA